MKHHYSKEKTTNNYTKEPFKFRPVHDPEHPTQAGKTYFAGDKANDQTAPSKKDSNIYDFFGALNY